MALHVLATSAISTWWRYTTFCVKIVTIRFAHNKVQILLKYCVE